MASIVWTGNAGDGNFNNPMNWQPQQVPGPSDTVTIDPSAATLINIYQADAVQALTTNSHVTLAINDGDSLTVGNAATANAALVNAGTISLNNNSYTTELIIGGPEVTLSGGGTIAMGNGGGNVITAGTAGDILDNTGNVIQGAGQLGAGALTYINGAGAVVDANQGNQLILNTGTVTTANAGLLEATGNGGGLVIESSVNNGTAGHITAAGGTVFLASGADIAGGTLSSTGTFAIEIDNAATLDGSAVTLTNTGTVAVLDNTTLTLLGAIANKGEISLNNASYTTDLIIGPGGMTAGTVTLSGGGTILLDNGGNNRIYGAIAGDTLVNAANTIEGAGQLGAGTLTLVNDATINASDSNALILNTGATVTNTGLIEATGSGGLIVESVINNSGGGTILAAGGNVVLSGGTLAGGLIKTSGGAAVVVVGGLLDGSAQTVTNDGLVSIIDSGTLSLLGTITNAGTISLNNNSYNTELIIAGATVTLSGGGTILLDNGGNNLILGAAGTDILINTNNLIEGAGQIGDGSLTFTNAVGGTVDASDPNQLVLNTGAAATANAGILEATAGSGGLVIQTAVQNASSGKIEAAGGDVFLTDGALITGGTLSSSGGASIQIGNSATLGAARTTITNTGSIVLQDGTTLTLLGTIANKGQIALDNNSYNTDLVIGPTTGNAATVTLNGGGTLALDNGGNNRIYGAQAGDTLVNANNTIAGAGQIGIDNDLVLVNDGTITATDSNALSIYATDAVTNNGLMESQGSGGLIIETVISNTAGTILAASGNVLLQNGADIQGGLLQADGSQAVVVTNNATLDGSAHTVTVKGLLSQIDGSTLTLLGTITNDGTIALNNNSYNTDLIAGGATVTLSGGGTILLDDGGSNRIYGAAASDVLVNVNNIIEGAGQLGAGQLTFVNDAAGIIDASQPDQLIVNTGGNVLINDGLMEATGGGLVLQTAVNDIGGGTLLANGANVYLDGGTIAGGVLQSGASGGIFIENGGGTLDGSTQEVTNDTVFAINDGQTLSILGTINNVGTIQLNNNSYNTDLIVNGATTTLTGHGTIALSDGGGNRIYGASASDVLINVNNLIEGAGQIGIGQLMLVNETAGIIDANASNTLTLTSGGTAVVNAGLIEATGSGGLAIETTVDSSSGGTILANGGNVYIGNGALAGGLLVSEAGGAIVVDGHGTLDGSAHAITSDALVYIDDGSTLTMLGSFINNGTLAIGANSYNTDLIVGSPTLTLTGMGTIALSQAGGNRIYGASATDVLHNVGNTIEGAGQIGVGQLTLINGGIIAATDATALIINLGSTGLNQASGEMLAEGSGGLIFQNGIYTNLGLIQADNGSFVSFSNTATLTNDNAGGTLTGGTYAALDTGNDATLSITGAAVGVLDATIDLSGTGASISFGGVNLDTSLYDVAAGGTLDLLGGLNFIATANGGTFTDNGAINLGGGTFTAASLTIGAGADFTGFGEIMGPVVNDGTITIAGGELIFAGPVTGDGTITTGKGGIVVLEGGGNINQAVGGSGTLVLQSGSYTLANGAVGVAVLDVSNTATLSGTGTITGMVDDTGTVAAMGGTLTLAGALSGNGTIAAAAGSVLREFGGGTFSGTIEGAGTVRIDKGVTFGAGIMLDAANVIETAGLTLGKGADITNMAGHVYTIEAAGKDLDRRRAEINVRGARGDVYSNAGTLAVDTRAMFTVAFDNTGLVDVTAGTLTLGRALSGGGTFAIDKGAMLAEIGGGTTTAMLMGAGTAEFTATTTFDAGASLSVGSVIDTSDLILGKGESLTNLAGNSFTFASPAEDDGKRRAEVAVQGGAGSVYTNAGTVSSSAATASFGLSFVNSGLVSATAGTLSFLAAAANNGSVIAAGGTISFKDAVSGTGSLVVGAGGTVALLAGAGMGQTADFSATTGELSLTKPLDFAGTIDGFGGSDRIDLVNTAETSYSFANGILTVENGSKTVASLHFGGSYTTQDFVLGGDGNHGTVITFK